MSSERVPDTDDSHWQFTDGLADVTYTYWNDKRFVLCITYAAADIQYVPSHIMAKDGRASATERFIFRSINGEWFTVDCIGDRLWFEVAVSELK